MVRNRNPDIEDDIDALFRLPLTEFTAARNTLAAQLKKSGQGIEAERVKSLAKPTISAWAVNQLYWNNRDEYDRLIATGERFRQAQTSRLAGKKGDMRTPLDARREALTNLSDLATALLRDAGHNPTPDTIHRITTTLEAVSAYSSHPDGPTHGRLTHDVDPPGFESFASLIPGAGIALPAKARVTLAQKSGSAKTSNTRKAAAAGDVSQLKETHQARIAAAKVSVQDAKRLLSEARARAQSAEAAQKKAYAEVKETEKQSREAEERLKRARAAKEDAARRARSVSEETEEARKVLEDAKRAVEKATKELESLFREPPDR